MTNTEFKNFKKIATDQNIDETGWMGFAWINLTERQINQMCNIAEAEGKTPDEKEHRESNSPTSNAG